MLGEPATKRRFEDAKCGQGTLDRAERALHRAHDIEVSLMVADDGHPVDLRWHLRLHISLPKPRRNITQLDPCHSKRRKSIYCIHIGTTNDYRIKIVAGVRLKEGIAIWELPHSQFL